MSAQMNSMGLRRRDVLGDTLWSGRLPSGLAADLLPKKGWRKRYALIGPRFGAIDLEFHTSRSKKRHRVPWGIAHFLEHKMFEKEDGDVMDRFTRLGANSNAMTGFHYTGYLFECTENYEECLDLLVDFVSRPYFTAELVEKEKGIIGEEIKMYLDDPSWRGYMGLLELLYGRHPIAIDIAGTLESIEDTVVDDLNLCHAAFYRPENMHLSIAGDFDLARSVDIIEARLEKNRRPEEMELRRHRAKMASKLARKKRIDRAAVSRPKLHLGYRIDREGLGVDPLELEIALELTMGAVLGRGGTLFNELFQEGLLDDSFGFEVYSEKDYAFLILAGDTKSPDVLARRLKKGIDDALNGEIPSVRLRAMRRKLMGDFVRSFDSMSAVCWNLFECHNKESDLIDYGQRLEKMKEATIRDLSRAAIDDKLCAWHLLEPI